MTLAGLRPGEKLYEEKLMAEEGLKKTKDILIEKFDVYRRKEIYITDEKRLSYPAIGDRG